MTTALSSRDSEAKEEVFAAYQELLGKLTANVSADANSNITRLDKQKQETTHRETMRVVESIVQESPQDIADHFSQFKSLVVESFDQIETKLMSGQDRVVEVNNAIKACEQRLKDMYGIVDQADSLAALIMAHQEKSAQFDAELINQKASLDRELKEHRQAFENEIAQKKRDLQAAEQESNHKLEIMRERERGEIELRTRQLAEKEQAVEEKLRAAQEEARLAVDHERVRIENEMRLKFDYEKKLTEKEMENERADFSRQLETERAVFNQLMEKERAVFAQQMEGERKTFEQQINALEAKIAHLESLKYSFNKLSFNSTTVPSIDIT